MANPLTSRAIIDAAALALFSQKGVSEISIKDLAKATGLSEGGLYRHFSSKEELADRVFSQAYRDIAAHMEDALSDAGPTFGERTAAIVRALYHVFDTQPTLLRFLLLRQHDALPRVEATEDTPMAVVQRLIAQGKERGEVDSDISQNTACALFVGIVLEPLTFRIYGAIEETAAPHADTTIRVALRALSPRS